MSAIEMFLLFGSCLLYSAQTSGETFEFEDCEILEIRLVDGWNDRSGRVEAKLDGIWGTICQLSSRNKSAAVICRSLGYNGTSKGYDALNAFGPASGLISYQINCSGNEKYLSECHRETNTASCNHKDDLGVSCSIDDMDYHEPATVRLVGGKNHYSGQVEIRIRHVWRRVCDVNFDSGTANVICQILGYATGFKDNRRRLENSNSDLKFSLSCGDKATDIVECEKVPCIEAMDASVLCYSDERNLIAPECGLSVKRQHSYQVPFVQTYIPLSELPCKTTSSSYKLPVRVLTPKIIGGTVLTDTSSFPWIAFWFAYDYGCGASIISEYVLISAAHCARNLDKLPLHKVLIGKANIYSFHSAYNIDRVIIHPMYDIALLRIQQKDGHGILFDNYAQPICLPTFYTPYNPKMPVIVAGWGRTKAGNGTQREKHTDPYKYYLKMTELEIVPNEYCNKKLNVTKLHICAGSVDGKGVCYGDSGGPLVATINGHATLLGIVSYGSEYCDTEGVYVNIQSFLPWIMETMQYICLSR